jgi:hypothetical protein
MQRPFVLETPSQCVRPRPRTVVASVDHARAPRLQIPFGLSSEQSEPPDELLFSIPERWLWSGYNKESTLRSHRSFFALAAPLSEPPQLAGIRHQCPPQALLLGLAGSHCRSPGATPGRRNAKVPDVHRSHAQPPERRGCRHGHA